MEPNVARYNNKGYRVYTRETFMVIGLANYGTKRVFKAEMWDIPGLINEWSDT